MDLLPGGPIGCRSARKGGALIPRRNSMITLKRLAISITLFMLIDTAQAMSVMTNATDPYNHNCSIFFESKPAERAAALAFAQGYVAARNMELSHRMALPRDRQTDAKCHNYFSVSQMQHSRIFESESQFWTH